MYGSMIHENNDTPKMPSDTERTSAYITHRRVILKPKHIPTGKTRHTVGTWSADEGLVRGAELPSPHELVIAQLPPAQGYYLLYLDSSGNEITDTYHDSLEDALDQAKWEFNIEFDEWRPPM